MLYGLEISKLRHSDTVQLEALQRSVLRRLQCLPNNTVNVAEYCLLEVRPVEQEIDFRMHAKRQMAVKDNDSNSWFIHCSQLLHKYNLLNIYSLKQHTNTKETQKDVTYLLKHKIDTYVHQSWIEEGSSKSYLAYLNLHDRSISRVHWCWKSTDHNIRGVHRALVTVKLLTGVYM